MNCPRCDGKTYQAPIKIGWRITAQGITEFPEYRFCVNGDWKRRVEMPLRVVA